MQDITHLLNRIAFGPRPGLIERVQQIGVDRYLEQQLKPLPLREAAAPAPGEGLMSQPRRILSALQAQKITRAVQSEWQLQEVMADFWFNHFNVFWGKNADRWLTPAYEGEAIRPHVLGKFHQLLIATAKSPAMLVYLDNHLSSAIRGINENYARELMELHTLGVNGGYTQKDVQEVARAFTGWSVQAPKRGGEFMFRPRMHDDGEKI